MADENEPATAGKLRGARLRELRSRLFHDWDATNTEKKNNPWSHDELAARANGLGFEKTSHSIFSNMEKKGRGLSHCGDKTMSMLCKLFGLERDDLLAFMNGVLSVDEALALRTRDSAEPLPRNTQVFPSKQRVLFVPAEKLYPPPVIAVLKEEGWRDGSEDPGWEYWADRLHVLLGQWNRNEGPFQEEERRLEDILRGREGDLARNHHAALTLLSKMKR